MRINRNSINFLPHHYTRGGDVDKISIMVERVWGQIDNPTVLPLHLITKERFCVHMCVSYPGIPPDSSLLAMSTSQDQTSNCHFRKPRTPHKTEPEWMPMRMSMSCFVRERTYLNIQIEKVRMDRFCYIDSSVMLTLNNCWARELTGTRTLGFIGFIL